jgi:hypothetical protein
MREAGTPLGSGGLGLRVARTGLVLSEKKRRVKESPTPKEYGNELELQSTITKDDDDDSPAPKPLSL